MNSYCCSSRTCPDEVGREHVELQVLVLHDLIGDLLPALIPGLARFLREVVESLALHVDDVAQLLCDVVVDAAEVVSLELVSAAAAQLLHQLAHALDPVAVAIAEAGLHQPPERGVEVAVVEQVVGDLAEDRVGIDVEAGLRPVPSGIAELRRGPTPQRHAPEATGSVAP